MLIFLSLFLYQAHALGTKCNQYIGDSYFTLNPLKHHNDYKYTLEDKSVLYWNFCRLIEKQCDIESRDTYAMVVSEDGDVCRKLTSDQALGDFQENLIDEEDPSKGIELEITGGDNYNEDGSMKWGIEFIINCIDDENSDLDDLDGNYEENNILNSALFNVTSVTLSKNIYIVEGDSRYGCPMLQLSKIWEYLGKHKIIFSIILVSIGIFECFFGYKLLKPTLFIVGYFTGFGLLVAVLGEFIIGPDSKAAVVWVILLITIFFGALLGYVMMSMKKIGFFCLGFWLGTIIAFLANNAFLYKIGHDSILWITIAILGSLAGFGSCIFHQHIVIVATGLVGAYSLIRPMGWIAEGFPNEFTLVKELKQGTLSEIPTEFYLFLALILIIAGIGIKFQYFYYYKDLANGDFDLDGFEKDDEDDEDSDLEDGKSQKKSIFQEISEKASAKLGLSGTRKSEKKSMGLKETLIKKKGEQELQVMKSKSKKQINQVTKQMENKKNKLEKSVAGKKKMLGMEDFTTSNKVKKQQKQQVSSSEEEEVQDNFQKFNNKYHDSDSDESQEQENQKKSQKKSQKNSLSVQKQELFSTAKNQIQLESDVQDSSVQNSLSDSDNSPVEVIEKKKSKKKKNK